MRRAAQGNLAAFAALVRAHEAPLRRFTRRLAGEDGDDVAQDALLASWRAIGQWRAEGSFAAWLRTIATRRYFDRRRSASGKVVYATLDEIGERGCDDSTEQRLMLEGALAALNPRERAAALLVFSEGHSHGEAAVILGVPLGTLKSIVARARAALIPLLEGASS
ncbi:MAG TPA: RNA polymerase sigma factor [Sphingomicrobium sp.]|nr:RNA polymerase sigma factor [Sphingomicrobium sp.]